MTQRGKRTLIVRADCGAEIGMGHVMRCLALAQAWQDGGGRVIYVMANRSPIVDLRLSKENIEIEVLSALLGSPADAAATAEIAKAIDTAWIVLDGYCFDGEYQRRIKDAGLKLLVLDDYGQADHYWADLILNQDLNADEALYVNREAYTRMLLGPAYALLRSEFRRFAPICRKTAKEARKVLVTMGGSDPNNVTLQVVGTLEQTPLNDLETIVVVGPGNPHWEQLAAKVRGSRAAIRLLRDPPNLPDLMAWCDMAVTAGGSTVWELARFAVPCLVVTLADNQEYSVRLLHGCGACRLLGKASDVTGSAWGEAILSLSIDYEARAAAGANRRHDRRTGSRTRLRNDGRQWLNA